MRLWKMAAAVAVAAAGAAAVAATVVERRATAEVRRAAAAAGLSVGAARFSWLAPLELHHVALAPRAGTLVSVDAVRIGWRLAGGADARAHVTRLALEGLRVRRGDLSLAAGRLDFDVLAWQRTGTVERLRLRQRAGGGTLDAEWDRRDGARQAVLAPASLDLGGAEVRWREEPVLLPGRWSGRLALVEHGGRVETSGAVSLAAARISLAALLGTGEDGLGAPTDVSLAWSASHTAGASVVERFAARSPGLDVEGSGRIAGAPGGARFDAAVTVSAELGGVLRTAGLRLPDRLAPRPDAALGTARFDLAVSGPLADRAAWRIAPRLRFDSTPEAVEAFQFLRRPFRYVPPEPERLRIDVSAGAPDFLPLAQVPPLFLRMLLVSEDAGFFGHPGIDVAEIPAAWAENVERGRLARGASTITQQLARNLFLSREKSYARKLEEAALALMLDAAVPKSRILEIYLNVIEWGPGIHGLVPAARHYFGKHPFELTTKEMAFLVCLVPSPVRYHSAHRAGHVGPGMEQLMQNLLARMLSLNALGEDEYERARDEDVVFAPEPGMAPSRTTG